MFNISDFNFYDNTIHIYDKIEIVPLQAKAKYAWEKEYKPINLYTIRVFGFSDDWNKDAIEIKANTHEELIDKLIRILNNPKKKGEIKQCHRMIEALFMEK